MPKKSNCLSIQSVRHHNIQSADAELVLQEEQKRDPEID